MTKYNNQNQFDADDVSKNKTIAALAYIVFFLPLICCPNSDFGKYHANQGLVFLIASVVAKIVLGIIPFIGGYLQHILGLAVLVFAVIGISNAVKGETKPLPLIGGITLLK